VNSYFLSLLSITFGLTVHFRSVCRRDLDLQEMTLVLKVHPIWLPLCCVSMVPVHCNAQSGARCYSKLFLFFLHRVFPLRGAPLCRRRVLRGGPREGWKNTMPTRPGP